MNGSAQHSNRVIAANSRHGLILLELHPERWTDAVVVQLLMAVAHPSQPVLVLGNGQKGMTCACLCSLRYTCTEAHNSLEATEQFVGVTRSHIFFRSCPSLLSLDTRVKQEKNKRDGDGDGDTSVFDKGVVLRSPPVPDNVPKPQGRLFHTLPILLMFDLTVSSLPLPILSTKLLVCFVWFIVHSRCRWSGPYVTRKTKAGAISKFSHAAVR